MGGPDSPCSILMRPSNIEMPPMDATVALLCLSVKLCSQPAFVDRAHWKGAVAFPAFFETCLALVRATRRLKMSPTTTPPDPTIGPLQNLSWHTHPVAKVDATLDNNSELSRSPERGRDDLLSCPKALLHSPSCSAETTKTPTHSIRRAPQALNAGFHRSTLVGLCGL